VPSLPKVPPWQPVSLSPTSAALPALDPTRPWVHVPALPLAVERPPESAQAR
jgi:hypothetical protein